MLIGPSGQIGRLAWVVQATGAVVQGVEPAAIVSLPKKILKTLVAFRLRSSARLIPLRWLKTSRSGLTSFFLFSKRIAA